MQKKIILSLLLSKMRWLKTPRKLYWDVCNIYQFYHHKKGQNTIISLAPLIKMATDTLRAQSTFTSK